MNNFTPNCVYIQNMNSQWHFFVTPCIFNNLMLFCNLFNSFLWPIIMYIKVTSRLSSLSCTLRISSRTPALNLSLVSRRARLAHCLTSVKLRGPLSHAPNLCISWSLINPWSISCLNQSSSLSSLCSLTSLWFTFLVSRPARTDSVFTSCSFLLPPLKKKVFKITASLLLIENSYNSKHY